MRLFRVIGTSRGTQDRSEIVSKSLSGVFGGGERERALNAVATRIRRELCCGCTDAPRIIYGVAFGYVGTE